jgi:hypothetical protein
MKTETIKTYLRFKEPPLKLSPEKVYMADNKHCSGNEIDIVSFEKAKEFTSTGKAFEWFRNKEIKVDCEVVKVRHTIEEIESHTLRKIFRVDDPNIFIKYKVQFIAFSGAVECQYYDDEQDARNCAIVVHGTNDITAEYIGEVEGVMVKGKFRELKA